MLKVEALEAGYDGPSVLHDISLTLNEGEVVALLGANGAGKTTFLRTLVGLLRARTGEIQFHDRRIDGLAPNQIAAAGIVMVPEGRRPFPQMTVEENLLMGAFLRKDRAEIRRDIQAMYTRFPRLGERRAQLAGSMSGGEQQMCAMARALMARPKALLLDEPSLGLAPQAVDAVFDLIADICREGMPVLLVEQNAADALALARRAYVLQNGRVVLEGMADAVRENADVRKAYLGR